MSAMGHKRTLIADSLAASEILTEQTERASSLHASGTHRSCDSVGAPILIHYGAASIIKSAPVPHQTEKHFVAIRNGRPAHPECIADTGLSLLGSFGDSSRAQESNC
jgi:hypothetical protein